MSSTKRAVAYFLILLFFTLIFFPHSAHAASCDGNIDGKSDAELQVILDQCNADIAAQQNILNQNQEAQTSIKQGIADLTASINKSQLEINAKAAQVKQLGSQIVQKTQYIGELSNKMDQIKGTLAKIIQNDSEIDGDTALDMLLSSDSLSNFFSDVDNYDTINQELHNTNLELSDTKVTTEQEKSDLQDKQSQESKLQYEQQQAQNLLQNYKTEQQSILKITQGQESVYRQVMAQKEAVKDNIRNRLFKTVGGEEMTFGDALKVIQPYESTVGVSSALVLAVLTQETSVDGLIGKNIGQCYYDQVASNNAGTVMSPSQTPSFLAITKNLGLDPEKTPVSCPIYSDGAYGGAMGPAQFMPTTWWNIDTSSGYADRVATVLGTSVASPFDNTAAFVGTALYLKDAQDICAHSFSKQSDLWACAAAKYYGGLALKGSKLSTFMHSTYGYGHEVATRATQFAKDIATLSI